MNLFSLALASRRVRNVMYSSPEEQNKIQTARLREIVTHAYETVPYYHRVFDGLGLKPSDIRTKEDLHKLPTITKADLRTGAESFISRTADLSHCIHIRTSGTSGIPSSIYYDEEAMLAHLSISLRWNTLFRSLTSSLRQRRANLILPNSASYVTHNYWKKNLPFFNFFQDLRVLSIFEPVSKNVEALNEFKPHIIYSYGSYLTLLMRHLLGGEEGDIKFKPRVVTFCADALNPKARKLIEDTFDCPVFGLYGAGEALGMGFECELHHGYHMCVDAYPINVIDENGDPVGEGESGEIVVSNLTNKAMVILNYRLGDRVRMGGNDCSCGCRLPMIKEIEGRSDDVIVLEDKLILPDYFLAKFREKEYVYQYQVIQEDLHNLRVTVIPSKEWTPIFDAELRKDLRAIVGDDISVTIELVKEIPRSSGGKYKTVISHVRADLLS